jgi:4-hydroxybenzoyl-CoA thioesterase
MAVHIGWGHCDPAGIVYFPRYFELFHAAMEAWFSEGLGISYASVIVDRRLGFPSVHTEADFVRPLAFGQDATIELTVGRVGRSSLELGYRVLSGPVGDGEEAAEVATGRTVCVVMDLDPERPSFRRAVPMPEDLRERIERFVSGP